MVTSRLGVVTMPGDEWDQVLADLRKAVDEREALRERVGKLEQALFEVIPSEQLLRKLPNTAVVRFKYDVPNGWGCEYTGEILKRAMQVLTKKTECVDQTSGVQLKDDGEETQVEALIRVRNGLADALEEISESAEHLQNQCSSIESTAQTLRESLEEFRTDAQRATRGIIR